MPHLISSFSLTEICTPALIAGILVFASCSGQTTTARPAPAVETATPSVKHGTIPPAPKQSIILEQTYSFQLHDSGGQNIRDLWSIHYPKKWEVLKESGRSVVIGSPEETELTTVNIQWVMYSDLQRGITSLKNQFSSAPDYTLISEGQYAMKDASGKALDGRQLLVEYENEGERYRQWQIIVENPSDSLSTQLTWAYTGATSQYDRDLPVAQAMLDSWKVSSEDL